MRLGGIGRASMGFSSSSFLSSALLAPFLAATADPTRAPDDLGPDEVVEGELGFLLDEFLTRLEGLGFSGVVGVEHEGQPILIRGYGLAERESGRPVTPETVFCTGS